MRKISNKINAAGMTVLVQKPSEMHRWRAYINIGMQKSKGNKQRYCVRVFKVFEVCVLLQGVTLNTPVTLQMWALCNTCQALAVTSWGNKNIRLYGNLQRISWRLMSGADRQEAFTVFLHNESVGGQSGWSFLTVGEFQRAAIQKEQAEPEVTQK